jgi:hypothetical protein
MLQQTPKKVPKPDLTKLRTLIREIDNKCHNCKRFNFCFTLPLCKKCRFTPILNSKCSVSGCENHAKKQVVRGDCVVALCHIHRDSA